MSCISYFLGANSENGFYSLYNNYVNQSEGSFLWILKGGAGCGKSSFMRKIGEAAQDACFRVEYVLCSGDPDSLDGVYIPALKTAYVDGTAPHVIDARLCGADSGYLDLGRHYGRRALAPLLPELEELKDKNAQFYKRAYALLKAAGAVRNAASMSGDSYLDNSGKRLDGILRRELGRQRSSEGRELRRFLSAISAKGEIHLPETCKTMCSRFFYFDASPHVGSSALRRAAQTAVNLGYNIITCPDPLVPDNLQAVLIPAISLGFLTERTLLPEGAKCRRINLYSREELSLEAQNRSRELRKLEKQLTSEAVLCLQGAKQYHDEMERLCNPYVDFDGVYEDAALHIKNLGLN